MLSFSNQMKLIAANPHVARVIASFTGACELEIDFLM
jgi:hypothetical protein